MSAATTAASCTAATTGMTAATATASYTAPAAVRRCRMTCRSMRCACARPTGTGVRNRYRMGAA